MEPDSIMLQVFCLVDAVGHSCPIINVTCWSVFASGHLPVKLPDYKNRLRVLVATYVTFSPDGTELLVNMGGEQVTI